jgi:hypothetical protein
MPLDAFDWSMRSRARVGRRVNSQSMRYALLLHHRQCIGYMYLILHVTVVTADRFQQSRYFGWRLTVLVVDAVSRVTLVLTVINIEVSHQRYLYDSFTGVRFGIMVMMCYWGVEEMRVFIVCREFEPGPHQEAPARIGRTFALTGHQDAWVSSPFTPSSR